MLPCPLAWAGNDNASLVQQRRAMLDKRGPIQRLGEQVGAIVRCVDVLHMQMSSSLVASPFINVCTPCASPEG